MADDDKALSIPIEVLWDEREEKRVVRRIEFATDMTPIAADAFKRRSEADERIAIVPARHRTYRTVIGAAAISGICWMAINALKSDTASLAKVLGAAVAAIGAVFVVREYKKRKSE